MQIHPELETIVAYVDNALPSAEWLSVYEHLARCRSCKESARMTERLNELTASLQEPQLSPDFFQKLHDKLPSAPAKVLRFPMAAWLAPALAAAASLALLVGGLSLAGPSASSPTAFVTPRPALAVAPMSAPLPGQVEQPEQAPMAVVPSTIPAVLAEEIRVSPGSDFHFLGQKGEISEFELKRGRVWIHETRVKIAVRTPHAFVVPIGTEFEVFAGPRGSQVLVWEGKVALQGGGHQNLTVSAGREARVDLGGFPSATQPLSLDRDRNARNNWNRRLVLNREDGPSPAPPIAAPQASQSPQVEHGPGYPTHHPSPAPTSPPPEEAPGPEPSPSNREPGPWESETRETRQPDRIPRDGPGGRWEWQDRHPGMEGDRPPARGPYPQPGGMDSQPRPQGPGRPPGMPPGMPKGPFRGPQR